MPPPGRPRCVPPYRPENGDEDVQRVLNRQGKIWVVGQGRTMGIFTSEPRARKQVEGVSNGHWRKAKSWAQALAIWGEECDAFHEDGCPVHSDLTDGGPTSRRDVDVHNAKPGVLKTDDAPNRYTVTQVTECQAYSILGFTDPSVSSVASSATRRDLRNPAPSTPQTPSTPRKMPASPSSASPRASPAPGPSSHAILPRSHRSSPARASPTKPSVNPPRSPLSTMDPVDAFSRMGIDEPITHTMPAKQWVIVGVNIFFAQRSDAVNYIITHNLKSPSAMLGSRSIQKLRAFARGEKYVAGPLDPNWSDDE
ncbi:hypothetical protein B0H16DRAFT_1723055 [Mycena metata]|uniref:Uncharacterized protein n=1 Tax=Mycena metata TaxID=1033252 RepID=A0AAD7IZU2_9AGAR|nr:hypothetical protein B0H16DRAFT_1723055 [Mycena metata]